MRAILTRAAGLAAVLLSALALPLALSASPAAAGGPTSALLSIPGAGSTASLYYTDPEYDELSALVGMPEPSGTFEGRQAGSGHESGAGVTVTWLIHDVEPWRVDRIYLGGEDGPWISTQVASGGSIWESPVVWHQPEDGARLADLLGELGLGTKASTDTSFEGVPGAPLPANEEPKQVAQSSGSASWWGRAGWAFGGLAGGLAGGAVLTLAWTRRRAPEQPVEPEEVTKSARADGYREVLAR